MYGKLERESAWNRTFGTDSSGNFIPFSTDQITNWTAVQCNGIPLSNIKSIAGDGYIGDQGALYALGNDGIIYSNKFNEELSNYSLNNNITFISTHVPYSSPDGYVYAIREGKPIFFNPKGNKQFSTWNDFATNNNIIPKIISESITVLEIYAHRYHGALVVSGSTPLQFTPTPPQFTAKVLTGCTPPVKCIDCNGIIHQIPSAPCNCTNPVCYEGCSSSSTAGVYCYPPYYCEDCYGVTRVTFEPPCNDSNPVCRAGCSSSSSSRSSSSSSSSSITSSSSSNNTTITIISVSPNQGPTTGGTPIALSGTNFTGINNLKIGGTAATNVNVENANSITATTPPGTIGLSYLSVSLIHLC